MANDTVQAVAARRVVRIAQPEEPGETTDRIVLAHDQRRVRRKRLVAQGGTVALLDLPEPVSLRDGARLVLEGGGAVAVVAAREALLEVRGGDARHLATLAWQIGNRHLPARIETDRILIPRERVIGAMLEGLGAQVRTVEEPFEPEGGAYASAHDHAHAHDHSDDLAQHQAHEHSHRHNHE